MRNPVRGANGLRREHPCSDDQSRAALDRPCRNHRKQFTPPDDFGRKAGIDQQLELVRQREVHILFGPCSQIAIGLIIRIALFQVVPPGRVPLGGELWIRGRTAVDGDEHAVLVERLAKSSIDLALEIGIVHVMKRERPDDGVAARQRHIDEAADDGRDRPWPSRVG